MFLSSDSGLKARRWGQRASITGLLATVLTTMFVASAMAEFRKAEVPEHYKSFQIDGDLALLYTFDQNTSGLAVNVAKPGTGDLTYLSKSPYGVWRGDKIFENSRQSPGIVVGRDGRLSALRTGTGIKDITATNWLPDFEKGYSISLWVWVYDVDDNFGGTFLNLGSGHKSGWRLNYTKARWAKEGILSVTCGTAEGSTGVEKKIFWPEVWHHVVLVANKGAMHLYVGGKPVGKTDKPLLMPKAENGPWLKNNTKGKGLRICGPWFSRANSIDHRLDELAGFSRALSAGEVHSLYQQGKPADIGKETSESTAIRLKKEAEVEKNLIELGLDIPNETWGYVTAGQAVNMTFSAPVGEIKPVKASYSLIAEDGKIITQETLTFPAELPGKVSKAITVEDPGHYLLAMQMLDSKGQLLKAKTYPLGVTSVALNRDPVSWLGVQNLVERPESDIVNPTLSRIVCNWAMIEPKKDEYRWHALDHLLFAKANENQELMVCFTGIPGWVGVNPEKLLDENGKSAYQRIWKKLTARYADVKYWEVWNAPDWNQYGLKRVPQYRQMLGIAAKEIRAKKKIVIGGAAWNVSKNWILQVLKDGGGENLDILAVQSCIENPAAPDRLNKTLKELRWALSAAKYPNLRVWNTGLGCRQAERSGLLPETHPRELEKTSSVPLAVERDAARWMIQSTIMQLAAVVQRIVIHPGISSFYPSLNHSDGNPSLKGLAMLALVDAVGATPKLMTEKTPSCELTVVSFSHPKGDSGLIAFSSLGEGELIVQPLVKGVTIRVVDMIGRPQNIESKTLKVGKDPVYIFGATIN